MCDNVSECMCTHLHHAHEHSFSFDSPYIPLMRWKKVCMWCAVFGFKCGRHASYPFIARDFACTRIHIGYVWISIVLLPNFSAFFFFRDEFPRMATIKHNKMYTYEFWKVAGNRAQMLNTCYVNFFHPHRTHTVELWMYRRIPAPCYASMCCWISMRFEQEFSSCARIVRRWWFCDRIYSVGDGDGRVEDKSHVRAINL